MESPDLLLGALPQMADVLANRSADQRQAIASRAHKSSDNERQASASESPGRELLLAGKAVGAPFVGWVAATLPVGEILRLLEGGPIRELIDLDLTCPECRAASTCAESFQHTQSGLCLRGAVIEIALRLARRSQHPTHFDPKPAAPQRRADFEPDLLADANCTCQLKKPNILLNYAHGERGHRSGRRSGSRSR